VKYNLNKNTQVKCIVKKRLKINKIILSFNPIYKDIHFIEVSKH